MIKRIDLGTKCESSHDILKDYYVFILKFDDSSEAMRRKDIIESELYETPKFKNVKIVGGEGNMLAILFPRYDINLGAFIDKTYFGPGTGMSLVVYDENSIYGKHY